MELASVVRTSGALKHKMACNPLFTMNLREPCIVLLNNLLRFAFRLTCWHTACYGARSASTSKSASQVILGCIHADMPLGFCQPPFPCAILVQIWSCLAHPSCKARNTNHYYHPVVFASIRPAWGGIHQLHHVRPRLSWQSGTHN